MRSKDANDRSPCYPDVPTLPKLVEIHALKKTFQHMGKQLDVLRGIDLELDEGEVVAIVGPSGAGKSTFLHILGTLDLPSTGTVKIAGVDITKLSASDLADLRNERVGFVFQFHHLLPEFNALENVMMPGMIGGRPRKELETRAMALLTEVGLGNRATHRPGELSGGEQQRVALARALLMNPKLLLADEPTGNLDSGTSKSIHDLFFEINERHGTTIVIVTLKDGKLHSDERKAKRPRPSAPVETVV